MKYANGKWNKAMVTGVLLYTFMLLDIIINTAFAHISNGGVSRITNALLIGPIVFNPISVASAFVLGTIFTLTGLFLKKKERNT